MIRALDSEMAVLGAAMCYAEDCGEAFERLRAEHFSEPLLGRVYGFIRQRGTLTDPTLVHNAFSADPAMAEFGGLGFLADLVDQANLYTLTAHVDAVLDAATRRELSHVAREAADRAEKSPGEGEALLGDLERAMADIARSNAAQPMATPVGIGALEMLETAYAGGFAGASVGLNLIDHVTGGIQQDAVWFVGGRTSMGKSVMGLNLARGIAEQGRGVLMFSLEMPKREVQARLIADIAYDRRVVENGPDGGNVRYGDILKGRGTHWQQDRARKAAKMLASLPFPITDKGGLTIEEIRSQALRQVRAWEKAGVQPGAILIDHIGLVKPHGRRAGDNKAAETADIVNELKGLAKQVRAPVIALVQVNRNTEGRNDKRPTLADLNWSGAIEQIADFICLLFRESYYLERSGDDEDRTEAVRKRYDMELLIAKNRSGPICNLNAFCDVACNAIRDIEPTAERRFG